MVRSPPARRCWPERHVTITFGRFTLPQLLSFIAAADGLVGRYGPLHLAAVVSIHALSIYLSPERASINAKR